jgi:CxxC motif-containing protein (DUF1111 family)
MKINSGKIGVLILSLFSLFSAFSACREAEDWNEENYDERLSGGSQTIFSEGVGAFSQAFPTLVGERMEFHELGDTHFEVSFVSSPAPRFQGLGTVYNNNSCFNCHINDGRGKPILSNESLSSILFRISEPGVGAHGGAKPAHGYGDQLQDKAIFGLQPEAGVNVFWRDSTVTMQDGETASLRIPEWTLINPYTALPAGLMLSARIAPPVHGLGLLEQVDASTISAIADGNDTNGDGISGRTNWVWDEYSQQKMIGRFGWKAEAPTLIHQVAGAYNQDMGITSYVMKQESSFGQIQHDGINDEPEVEDSVFNSVVFYVKTLAVPARRKVTDPVVRQGKELFKNIQCAACHIPTLRTKTDVTYSSLYRLIAP